MNLNVIWLSEVIFWDLFKDWFSSQALNGLNQWFLTWCTVSKLDWKMFDLKMNPGNSDYRVISFPLNFWMRIWFYPFSQTMPIPREYRDSFGVGGVKNQISFLKFLSLTFSVKSYLFIFSLLLLLPSLEIEKWNDFSARNHSLKSQIPTSTYLTPGKQEGMKGGLFFFFFKETIFMEKLCIS